MHTDQTGVVVTLLYGGGYLFESEPDMITPILAVVLYGFLHGSVRMVLSVKSDCCFPFMATCLLYSTLYENSYNNFVTYLRTNKLRVIVNRIRVNLIFVWPCIIN